MYHRKYKITALPFLLILSLSMVMGSCTTNKRLTKRTKRPSTQKTTKKYAKHDRSTKKTKVDRTSKLRNNILNTAKRYRGIKYVYGGKTPKGFDCSGFITYVMNKNGVDISGSSKMIAKLGQKKTKRTLKTGDLVFFGSGTKVSHIAMVVNNDNGLNVIHSTSSRGVVIDNITNSKYWQKKYLFGRSIL